MDIHGIIPPVITPVKENEDVDEGAFRDLLSYCVEKGFHALFVAGSNGEAMSMTQAQRNKAIEIALDEVGDRIPVLCGVMDTSTGRVIENIKVMENAGGRYAVATPAFYVRNSCRSEVIRHFEEIAKNTSADIIVYNIPKFTQVNIDARAISAISSIDKVIGLKDSSSDILQFQDILNDFRASGFKVFQGITNIAGMSILMGADGMIPVLAPLFPKIFFKLYEAASAGDVQKTIAMQKTVNMTGRILGMAVNPLSAAKFAISKLGLTHKRVIRPCEPLTAEEECSISRYIDEMLERFEGI